MLSYGGLHFGIGEVEALPPGRREQFVELLRDQKEHEQEQIDKARNK